MSAILLNVMTVTAAERNDSQVVALFKPTGLGFLSPDVELDLSELLDGRTVRGREAVEAYRDSLLRDVWQELSMEVEATTEHSDTVVALVRFRGVGRGSGVAVEMAAAWVATVRDGLVVNARLTLDREAALQAARATI